MCVMGMEVEKEVKGTKGGSGVGASSRSWLEVDREGILSEDEGVGDEEKEQLGPGSDFFI